jgi:hypothetical protein
VELLSWFVVGHLVGDFAWQSAWFAGEKGKSWEVNFYHAATYTAAVMVFGSLGTFMGAVMRFMMHGAVGDTSFFLSAPAIIFVVFVSHFLIDALKARYSLIKEIWQDQILHMVVFGLIIVQAVAVQVIGLVVLLFVVVMCEIAAQTEATQ